MMNEDNLQVEQLSPVKRALLEIRDLRSRLGVMEAQSSVPIAIVGAGMRFPGGVQDEATYWELLRTGRDAVTEIPKDRWDWRIYYDADADAPGKMYTQFGGFLEDIDRFDAEFFGVSRREAISMDPQQRMLLEVGWEALENAGYAPDSLKDSATGVFFGVGNSDYARMVLNDDEHIDAYTGSGNSPSMFAGRLSYVLGFHGPSLVLDTSCSSSLTAVHLACMSLRNQECGLALAGGVNLILSPEINIAFSKTRMMARDGRCKTFDASADGYVRAEGCGVVVLKRLPEAIADGDRILAVIRGSAVNHDGRSGGLTAPSGPAQEAVIRSAFTSARIPIDELGYVEAHGTGTSLGDPIEIAALAAVLSESGTRQNQLLIGSVKTNFGHAEAASGIAGLIKVALSLKYKMIPPHLHLKEKSSHIDWANIPISVPIELQPWKAVNGRRVGSVSSFGFSGTNAHVVLEEAPPQLQRSTAPVPEMHILTLSARSETALHRLRLKYSEILQGCSQSDLADICATANSGRANFVYRLAVVGKNAEEIRASLAQGIGVVSLGNNPEEPSDTDDRSRLESVAASYLSGKRVDWALVNLGYEAQKVALPTYPFEGEKYRIRARGRTPTLEVWTRLNGAALEQSLMVPIGLGVEGFELKLEVLKQLSSAEIVHAFHELDLFQETGSTYDLDTVMVVGKIADTHRRLMTRWLERLSKEGYLEHATGGKYRSIRPVKLADRSAPWQSAEAEFKGDPALLAYLRNCARVMIPVLTGAQSPLETLFPGGADDIAGDLYERSPASRYGNWMVAAAVRAACSTARGQSPNSAERIRILEVGAGTGSTTATVLRELQEGSAEYIFTDVSQVFLDRATTRFSEYDFIRYDRLNLEEEQDIERYYGYFDIVIGANVVHATRNLELSASRLASMLIPGGSLVLLESTQDHDWHDISTGLIEGWQHFSDGLRADSPLIGVDKWRDVLLGHGFAEVAAYPEKSSLASSIGLHLITARTAAADTFVMATPQPMRQAPAPRVETNNATVKSIRETLRDVLPSERRSIVSQRVREEVAQTLRMRPGTLPALRDRLMEIGMDSLMAVEFRNRLAVRFELDDLSSTMIFDYPTPDDLTTLLMGKLGGGELSTERESIAPVASNESDLSEEEIHCLSDEHIAELLRARLGHQ